MVAISKTGRLSVKLPHDAAKALDRAAALSGVSLDGFVVQAALKEARRVIERDEDLQRNAGEPSTLFNFSISHVGLRRR